MLQSLGNLLKVDGRLCKVVFLVKLLCELLLDDAMGDVGILLSSRRVVTVLRTDQADASGVLADGFRRSGTLRVDNVRQFAELRVDQVRVRLDVVLGLVQRRKHLVIDRSRKVVVIVGKASSWFTISFRSVRKQLRLTMIAERVENTLESAFVLQKLITLAERRLRVSITLIQ